MGKLTVTKIRNLNVIVIKKSEDDRSFISTKDSVIISIPSLTMILKFLIRSGLMDKKVLYGILSEIEE